MSTVNSPSVSVYVPTYRRPEYLARALQSLAGQTHTNIQVLVCEDPSDKSCAHVIERFEGIFSDFVFLKNARQTGPCFSRNRMIDAADGEYITGLDDDDLFEGDRIERFVKSPHLDDASFLSSKTAPIDPGPDWFPMRDGGRWISFDDMKRANLAGQIFVRKNFFQQSGSFDTNMLAWQDYDAWFRLVKHFGPGYRLGNESYRANFSADFDRITTSSKAHEGFKQFIVKHAGDLSATDLVYLQLRDYENRNIRISLKDVLHVADGLPWTERPPVMRDYLKNYVGAEYPWLKRAALVSPLYQRRGASG